MEPGYPGSSTVHSVEDHSPSGLSVMRHLISESLVVHLNLQASKDRVVSAMAVTPLVDEFCPPSSCIELLTPRP